MDTSKQTYDDIMAGKLSSRGVRVVYAAPPAQSAEQDRIDAEPDELLEVVKHTIATIGRQLDLIAERAPGKYLDKGPVWRSLTQHKIRLERAVSAHAKGASK
jgi:hypothetical protein